MANALFFPYIRTPQAEWSIRTILYWDRVGAIVPSEFMYSPASPRKLDGFTAGLVDTGLVTVYPPSFHIFDIPRFFDAFLELVDSPESGLLARRGAPDGYADLHLEKLGPLSGGLLERGLALAPETAPWQPVERRTAEVFMAYLASCMGSLEEIDATPVTDNPDSLKAMGGAAPNVAAEYRKAPQRTVFLEALLPAPSRITDIARLARFKEEHGPELARFRTRIERAVRSVASVEDATLRDEARNDQLLDLLRERLEAEELLRGSWPDLSFANVSGLIGGAGTAAVADSRLGVLFAVLGLAPVVASAFGNRHAGFADHPMAYSVEAVGTLAAP